MTDSSTTVDLSWDNPDQMLDSMLISGSLGAKIFRNDSLIRDLSGLVPGTFFQMTDTLPSPQNYEYKISVYDDQGREGIRRKTARKWSGGALEGIVIWDLDPNPASREWLLSTLDEISNTSRVFVTDDPHSLDLNSRVDAVFVFLGVYPNMYHLDDSQSNRLINYLSGGGNLYLEGGDFWSEAPQQGLAIFQYFHTLATGPGQNDLFQVEGEPGTIMDGIQFSYSGENQSIDDLTNWTGAEVILRNPTDGNGCAVSYDDSTYRTIGASFQIGGISAPGNPAINRDFLMRILDFFSMPTAIRQPAGEIVAEDFVLQDNYPNPFNNSTTISYSLPQNGVVKLKIYNILGQIVDSRNLRYLNKGWHKLGFNATDLNSGIYFYRVTLETNGRIYISQAKKMVYIK